VLRPGRGTYSIVFDSPTRAGAGRFTFRFWVGDSTPPRARLLNRSARPGGSVVAVASDRGAGVDFRTSFARINGRIRPFSYDPRRGRIWIPTAGLQRGRHRLELHVSDHQEAKNMENALRILPNTRIISATIRIR
jgi:hypothetical protein